VARNSARKTTLLAARAALGHGTLAAIGELSDSSRPVAIQSPMNVCGHPYSLQIRSNVSKVGDRVPASISRYSRTLTPKRHAAWHSRTPSVRDRVGASRGTLPGSACDEGYPVALTSGTLARRASRTLRTEGGPKPSPERTTGGVPLLLACLARSLPRFVLVGSADDLTPPSLQTCSEGRSKRPSGSGARR
jgi:hypothetical protein